MAVCFSILISTHFFFLNLVNSHRLPMPALIFLLILWISGSETLACIRIRELLKTQVPDTTPVSGSAGLVSHFSFRMDWLDLLAWSLQKLAAGQIRPRGHNLHTSTVCVWEAAFQPFICQEKAGILGPPINCSGVFASKMNSKQCIVLN